MPRNQSRTTIDKALCGQDAVRVLFFDHTAALGGGEIALLHLVSNIDTSRFTPIVLLGEDGDLTAKMRECGVETYVLQLSSDISDTRKDSLSAKSILRIGTISRMANYIRRLTDFMREHAIDIVHTNSLKSDVLGGFAARLIRLPVIWHVRDRISPDYLPAVVVRLFRHLCRFVPNFIIANSASTLETLQLSNSTARAVVLDAVGPHYASRAASAVERSPRSARSRVGIVGRITPWKGQHIFIHAVQRIIDRFPEVEFQIIGSAMFGEEKYEAELHSLVAECGLEQIVQFLGFRKDVDELIESLDVLVHASIVPEPFGQVVIEGMAVGTPVVATRGGGVTEIIEDGITGILVTMGSAEEMADAVITVLSDPDRANRMAIAAQKAVLERFAITTLVPKVQNVYTDILRARQRRENIHRDPIGN